MTFGENTAELCQTSLQGIKPYFIGFSCSTKFSLEIHSKQVFRGHHKIKGLVIGLENAFFAMLSRMKYINRWGLMNSVRSETLSEHSLDVAVIAHALAVIGKKRLDKSYNEEHIALIALFHDTSEILTGDLPTPVKYKNDEIKSAYKKIENDASEQLISSLPEDLKDEYRGIMIKNEKTDIDDYRLVKAADKLSALIKCIEEKKFGNTEFDSAYTSTLKLIKELDCPEAEIFLSEFIPAYSLNLDEQSN